MHDCPISHTGTPLIPSISLLTKSPPSFEARNNDFNVSLVNVDEFMVGSFPEIWEDGMHIHQENLTGFVVLPDGTATQRNLSYYIGEAIVITIGTNYGDLFQVP